MSADWYALLSLGMRYWFTALAALIVFRAWRATVRDSRRARVLRAWAPDTGAIGEIVVVTGGAGIRKGSRVPVPKEGLLGSSRRADVRLRHPDVRRYHAHIEQRENGLLVEPLGKAQVFLNGQTAERLLLRDGDRFSIGRMQFLLTLYAPGDASARAPEAEDELFSPAGISAARAGKQPARSRAKAPAPRTRGKKLSEIELFMPFEDDPSPARGKKRAAKKTPKGKTGKDEPDWWQDAKR